MTGPFRISRPATTHYRGSPIRRGGCKPGIRETNSRVGPAAPSWRGRTAPTPQGVGALTGQAQEDQEQHRTGTERQRYGTGLVLATPSMNMIPKRTCTVYFTRFGIGPLSNLLCACLKGPTHVAISFDGVVLDPLGVHSRWVERIYARAMQRHGFLQAAVQVETSQVPSLPTLTGLSDSDKFEIVRHATRFIRRRDCVSVVSTVLRSAGVSVPWWVFTPRQLLGWLHKKGAKVYV